MAANILTTRSKIYSSKSLMSMSLLQQDKLIWTLDRFVYDSFLTLQ